MKRRRGAAAAGGARMADVAALAGVSAQTVSRVLGRPELVGKATREKVLGAIAALNYIPNEAARNLASSRSRVVAAIIPTLASQTYAAEISSVVQVLERRNIALLIGDTEYSPEREETLIASFLERQPLGFIVTGLQHTERSRGLLQNAGVPVVETWETDGEPIDMAVGFSNEAAGADVGKLLAERGTRCPAFVGGEFGRDSRARSRFEGMNAALRTAGLPPATLVELPMPAREEDGVLGLNEALRLAPDTDAIFFSGDALAITAVLECKRRGISVPDELAICGFGDYSLAARILPALTTVRIGPELMGRTAAERLLARLDGEDVAERKTTIRHELVRRESA